jgi:hypothetical protein
VWVLSQSELGRGYFSVKLASMPPLAKYELGVLAIMIVIGLLASWVLDILNFFH